MMFKVCLVAVIATVAQAVPYNVHGYGPAGYAQPALVAPASYGAHYGAPYAALSGLVGPAIAPAYGHAPVKFLPPVVHAPIPVSHDYGYGGVPAPYGHPAPIAHAPVPIAEPVVQVAPVPIAEPLAHAPLPIAHASIHEPIPIAEPIGHAPIAPVAKYGIGHGPEYAPKSVSAAILSSRQVGFREFINQGHINEPTNVFIDAPVSPVNLVYRSMSSPVSVQNLHLGNTGTFKHTASVDEPHHTVHTVTKPVIQELHEVIAPVRKVKQEVLPVREEVQTLIAKAVGAKHHAPLHHAPLAHGPVFAGAGVPLIAGHAPVIKKGPLLPLGALEPVDELLGDELSYHGKHAVFGQKSAYYKKRA